MNHIYNDQNKITTIGDLFKEILQFYSTSNRSMDFVKKLYAKDNLYDFYINNTAIVKNIIITANIYHLPKSISKKLIKKFNIFILVIYFDNLEHYILTPATKPGTKSSSSSSLSSSSSETNQMLMDFINIRRIKNVDNKTFFSTHIGIPSQISVLLSNNCNVNNLNILNLNNRNKYLQNVRDFFKTLNKQQQ